MKLTATGLPFGKGEIQFLGISFDQLWEFYKREVVKAKSFENCKKTCSKVPRFLVYHMVYDQFRSIFPSDMEEEQVEKYVQEIVDLIYE